MFLGFMHICFLKREKERIKNEWGGKSGRDQRKGKCDQGILSEKIPIKKELLKRMGLN